MRLLIIRLTALGDVAMTLPLVYPLAKENPNAEFYFLSLPFHRKLFIDAPTNLHFISVDTKDRHRGFCGLIRLFGELRQVGITHVADLHNVLRSTVITTLFRLFGVPVATIDKGRLEKRRLTQRTNKQLRPLTTTFDRYTNVFRQLGFSRFTPHANRPTICFESETKAQNEIGIAPFAKYNEKTYPPKLMERVVELLSQRGDTTIYLFGGGVHEREILEKWADRYPNTISTVGRQGLEEELRIIARLRVMLAMDSANMHLASLVGTPVVSIWGATHPYAGFYGWGQLPDHAIQADLPCRPCSVFGNKPCHRKDLACMNTITPQKVVEQLLNLLSNKFPNSNKKTNQP